MNGPVKQKRTIRWTSSPHPLPRPPRPRPKRRFALIAISSTLIVCSAAIGIAALGMKQNATQHVVEEAQPVRSASAQPASSRTPAQEDRRTAPRLKASAERKDKAGETAPQPPAPDNPRWRRAFAAPGPTASEKSAALRRKLVDLGSERIDSRLRARADGLESDPTGSISAQTAYAEVSVAETADQIAALEAIVVPDKQDAEKSGDASASAPVSWEAQASDMRQAWTSDAVNFRAQPGTDAEILGVVPRGAAIEASADCMSWCAVSYDGRHGWIFKDYVRFSQTASAPAESTSNPAQAEEPQAQAEKPLPPPTRAHTTLERTRSSR